jgi:hypothetical protein
MDINPLNAELNPICHLLILLGDLTLIGTCIVSIFNKMQRYTVYLYLETDLHVSGGTCILLDIYWIYIGIRIRRSPNSPHYQDKG